MTRRKNILDSDLASLADGSLSADRRREIEDQLHESDAARESIAQQRTAVDLVRGIDAEAPQSLHRAVEEMVDARQPGARTRRTPLFAGAAVALGASAIAVFLIAGGGAQPIDNAAQLAQAGPQTAAPAHDARWLNVSVGNVRFPYWADNHGWQSYGARSDNFNGRTAKTVFYRDASGRKVAYTIVGGSALAAGGGKMSSEKGISYRVSNQNGTHRVVWQRGGHTCILTASAVPTSELQTLVD